MIGVSEIATKSMADRYCRRWSWARSCMLRDSLLGWVFYLIPVKSKCSFPFSIAVITGFLTGSAQCHNSSRINAPVTIPIAL